jgi:hypothetical protein
MTRNRVAPGSGHGKPAHRATREFRTGSPMRGTSQVDKQSDEPDPGPYARPDTGVVLKCILNTHG